MKGVIDRREERKNKTQVRNVRWRRKTTRNNVQRMKLLHAA